MFLNSFFVFAERRFTKKEVLEMMQRCGLENISFGEIPYWTAVGYKK